MKIFNTKEDILNIKTGEFLIGSELTGSHACYLIYGVVEPEEKGRVIKPGKGHEEIVLIIKGKVKVTGDWNGLLSEGQAIHLADDESLFFENLTDQKIIYVIAGGHSEKGHSH